MGHIGPYADFTFTFIKGPHQEHSNKRVKQDTLFKDQEHRKPYPIPRHVPIYPIYGSTPPPRELASLLNGVFKRMLEQVFNCSADGIEL